jgi:hypothetical protein
MAASAANAQQAGRNLGFTVAVSQQANNNDTGGKAVSADAFHGGLYVWYFVWGRWHAVGPFNSYDAYQVLNNYLRSGYRAYIGGPYG